MDKQLVTDEREAAVMDAGTPRGRAVLRQIAAQLDSEGLVLKGGGQWQPQTVSRVLARTTA